MAEKLGEIYYEVRAEAQQLITGAARADKSISAMENRLDKADKSVNQLNASLKPLAATLAGLFAGRQLVEAQKLSEEFLNLEARVTRLAGSADAGAATMQRLLQISSQTGASAGDTVKLWESLTGTLRELGQSNDQVLALTTTLQKIGTIGGSSADEMSGALRQLGQGLAGGVVRAEEFNSVLEGMPELARQIGAGMGLSMGQLRTAMNDGKLTTEAVLTAIQGRAATVDTEFAKLPRTVSQASNALRNGMGSALAALDKSVGASTALASAIDAAGAAVKSFAGDAGAISTALTAMQLAATSLAAVIAGRLVTALAAGAGGLYQRTIAASAAARADLAAAEAAAALATAQVEEATAAAAATVGLSTHAAMAARLAAAEAEATVATTALTAAQQRMAGVATVATATMGGLRAAMAFLGGPAGVVLLAAGALATFALRAEEAKAPTDLLAGSVNELGDAALRLQRIKLEEAIAGMGGPGGAAQAAGASLEYLRQQLQQFPNSAKAAEWRARIVEQEAAAEAAGAELAKYQERLEAVNAELSKRDGKTNNYGAGPTTRRAKPITTEDGQKALSTLRDQVALAQQTGVARERLAALQKLGEAATAGERAEAEKLATQLYDLEQAQHAATEAEKSAEQARGKAVQSARNRADAERQNAGVLADLQERLQQAGMSASELAQRQAELSLNEYATPEQIAQARQLAQQLQDVVAQRDALQARKQAFGTDVAGTIRGDVQPLQGGKFDDQQARYAAEQQQEDARYATALQRLQEAQALKLEVVGGYQALEQQMAEEHANRLAQIDQARAETMLASGESGFASLAEVMKSAQGEQSGIYRAMFAASKGFAIAQSLIAVRQAIAQAAAAAPWPANLAAMASVASATAGLVSNIASVNISGGRAMGGPVSAGNLYRVNEGGQPEIFQARDGSQYAMPTTSGRVISNADATAGSGGVIININNNATGAQVTASSSGSLDGQQVIDIVVADIASGGRTRSAIRAGFGLRDAGR